LPRGSLTGALGASTANSIHHELVGLQQGSILCSRRWILAPISSCHRNSESCRTPTAERDFEFSGSAPPRSSQACG